MQRLTPPTPTGMSAGRGHKPSTCWDQMGWVTALWWALVMGTLCRPTTGRPPALTPQPLAPLTTSMLMWPTHMCCMGHLLEVSMQCKAILTHLHQLKVSMLCIHACSCDNISADVVSPHVLYGALVGGKHALQCTLKL